MTGEPKGVHLKVTKEMVIGWTWAKACSMLDKGEDPREYEVPKLLDDFARDFKEDDRAFDKNCDTCSITGLLCPIKDEQAPNFPCKHWKD